MTRSGMLWSVGDGTAGARGGAWAEGEERRWPPSSSLELSSLLEEEELLESEELSPLLIWSMPCASSISSEGGRKEGRTLAVNALA